MQMTKSVAVVMLLAGVWAGGCSAGPPPEDESPAASPRAGSFRNSVGGVNLGTVAGQAAAPSQDTSSTDSAAPSAGGGMSPMLGETLTAIEMQNTIAESEAAADATARAAHQVARDQLGAVSAQREEQMNEVLDSLPQ